MDYFRMEFSHWQLTDTFVMMLSRNSWNRHFLVRKPSGNYTSQKEPMRFSASPVKDSLVVEIQWLRNRATMVLIRDSPYSSVSRQPSQLQGLRIQIPCLLYRSSNSIIPQLTPITLTVRQ